MQHLEVLPLVFVNALRDGVDHGRRIDGDAGLMVDVVGEPYFDVALHLCPVGAELRIVGELFELVKLVEVAQPSVADLAGHQGRLLGVGDAEPAARGDSIGDVEELLGPHFVEIAQ